MESTGDASYDNGVTWQHDLQPGALKYSASQWCGVYRADVPQASEVRYLGTGSGPDRSRSADAT